MGLALVAIVLLCLLAGRQTSGRAQLGPARKKQSQGVWQAKLLLDALDHGLSVRLAATGHVNPAGNAVSRDNWLEAGVLGHAPLDGVRAARLEWATCRRIDQIWRQPLDRYELFLARLVQTWNRLQQAQRV